MIPRLFVIFGSAVLLLSVNSRVVRLNPGEMESASRFVELGVVVVAFLAGILALWDTAMNRGGIWWAVFIPYSLLGLVAGLKAKRRMEDLVRASKSPTDDGA